MTAAKDKATAFLTDYHQKVQTISQQIQDTNNLLGQLKKAEHVLKSVELPTAIDRRVLEGDAAPERKIKKELEKVAGEILEKQEDLLALENALKRYHQKAADQVKQINRIFQDEKNMVTKENYDRMIKARTIYETTLKDTETIQQYREIERQLMEVEVQAKRRAAATTVFPIHELDIIKLAIERHEVHQLLNR